ncbi:metallophosphoesterase family protein [Neobacillus sp. PS2-9]|uniref:metallophosphoesterase family protein n=1 Tax=Neobacillus sp. PS2-9 TaxID=3070676 RepID=UPI0027DFFFC1|nr:metallophosphoesterase family protein [Neobacillus sp. PS2-9]WML56639.1 metallophosphoesterase family protein [Neobacillus sp. PS2-9]
MEKIAVISDIHGNIPALESVLIDIGSRNIKRIICLGDLVGKGPQSNMAIQLIQKHCDRVIRGNWDDFFPKPQESDTIKWHQNQLPKNQMDYLKDLPFSVEFMMSGKLVRMFHASPRSVYERIQPWDLLERRLSMFENTAYTENIAGEREPDVVCYGDIHNAYQQNIKGKTLCNVGSVGNPLDLTQASYSILEGEYNQTENGVFSIHLVRVPYDIELSIQLAKEAAMPELEEYIQELTTAKYRGLNK